VRRRVLIVDDHVGFRARARQLLESEGYDVVGEAQDGTTALAEAARLGPDIVLLDVQLPDLDGFEVAHLLMARGVFAAVILISGRDRAEYGDQIEASPALGFLPKSELSAAAIDAFLLGMS
jgi:DNA-binding NarL/FixJ family response regulator